MRGCPRDGCGARPVRSPYRPAPVTCDGAPARAVRVRCPAPRTRRATGALAAPSEPTPEAAVTEATCIVRPVVTMPRLPSLTPTGKAFDERRPPRGPGP